MAEPLYPAQFAVVGTQTQGDVINAIDVILGGNQKAMITRSALNLLLGLDGNGHLKPDDTLDEVAARVAARLKPVPVDPATLLGP